MKIGRNDLCPCGSGLKYKKCCLRSGYTYVTKVRSNDTYSCFEHVRPIAAKLYDRIKKYKFEDLIKAVFCLNLWRRNRSALKQAMTLNMCLSDNSSFGTTSIRNYEEFSAFFSEISDLLPVTYAEEYIVDDYGEIFINHQGKTYPIITGTGYQLVYASIRYLQTLASMCGCDAQLISVLEYVNTIIASTKDTNTPNQDCSVVYELPTEAFWNVLQTLFANTTFESQYKTVSTLWEHQNVPIEARHFIKRDGEVFPIWNASILIDYYKMLICSASQEVKRDHVVETIHRILENSYNFEDREYNRILLNPWIMSSDLKQKRITKGLLFAATTPSCLLVAINENDLESEASAKHLANTIKAMKDKEGLCFLEPYRRDGAGGSYGLNVDSKAEIVLLLVDPFTDITSHATWLEEENAPYFHCNALDFLYLIGFSDELKEVAEYIHFYKNDRTHILSFAGKSSHFFTWKKMNHFISSGAIEFQQVGLDTNETEEYVRSYFSDKISNFPRNNCDLFSDPLNWKVSGAEMGYNILHHKGCRGFGGHIKHLDVSTSVFLAHNVDFFSEEDFEQNNHTALRTIDELNQRLFLRYSETISDFEILKGKTLQILYMPWKYANENHKADFLNDSTRQLVFSDAYLDKTLVIIRYSVNPQTLLTMLQQAKDRSAENCYFEELLSPLSKYSAEKYKLLVQKLHQDATQKKTVGVFSLEQHYYFSDFAVDTTIDPVSLTRVRKHIAQTCMASGIDPGNYQGKAATKIIRKIQPAIVHVFEDYISKFDQLQLHYQTLNYLAIQQHGIIMHAKRYSAFSDLDESVQEEFERNTREKREMCRKNAGTAKYLLESNLAVPHLDNAKECSKEGFAFLLAFADWLVVLQDDADMCHHEDPNFIISVDGEYKIDPILSEEVQAQYESLLPRKYGTNDYQIKNDSRDEEYLKKAISAFNTDTGVDFSIVTALLDYMQLSFMQADTSKEIYHNVFEIERSVLEKQFFEALTNPPSDLNAISAAIDFLTLNQAMLKVTDGKKHDILPIWEREKRNNRFSVKPIIMVGTKCIFSPVLMGSTLTLWKSGILDWYLPYEVGLPNVVIALKQWKKRYEDEMVQDIACKFRDGDFDIVDTEVDLYKRFPRDLYPEDLGDYDVLAISKFKKELWIIESKVLQKVGSIYEVQMQQKDFFIQKEYDQKFQRRIDFATHNVKRILASFGINEDGYNVVPYMVTNKVFAPMYKKISFPIISLSELRDILHD